MLIELKKAQHCLGGKKQKQERFDKRKFDVHVSKWKPFYSF